MASWLTFSAPRNSCIRSRLFRYYSDISYQNAAKKWQLGGIPKPKSILEDDDAEIDLSEDEDAVNGASPNAVPLHLRSPSGKPTPAEYRAHRETMQKKFPDGWSPPRKLSREAMDALRQLNRIEPQTFTTSVLADKFKISPEAVRRILKSKWEPGVEKRTKLAMKEREFRQAFIKERREKELLETENTRELQKMFRRSRRSEGESDLDPPGEEHGLDARDTFTFR
ncbi:hypothetical protein D9613_009945 [Agrocybe pediades]|uniref:Required for respiratory growth protein 9, mitochondrial n=1 Tax=Agrocybe pediades TaxID=84607 RepID=A0A8H4QWU7_9AGAR|nr:hypothetical protein D9613_009945 [Agrocybe pediades]